ncbi:GMC oxidoreductase [Aplosporella prunicola CBS 121167]|uniref:GMC oxidoreductase n=1 Tax=Aplosporella prunicola CBS 121167 TaxID=1176127 RepID=A0A6A6AZ88_9PEZI|nr:GMC oxidoreductase [Aplosporella prunicola CBS 121167]KAF2136956.1 GMC oxidoreductase [Aplosporella prunicola CBS 121167]
MGIPTEFDFVIVGGGTAGLVVAARLSEDPSKTIAVIEAGANRKGDPRIDVPGLMGTLYEDPAYDWSYITEPQTALDGRQIACPRGKVLGGSSALNFSAILYPSKADFNDWAEITGDQGWSAHAFAPYLRKFQTWTPASEATKKQLRLDYMEDANQGNNGPLNVTIPDGYGPFHEAWVNGFDELGHHSRSDPIGGENLGSFTSPLSIHPERRTREYSASAYFTDEVAQRPNLHVFTETTVEKLEFAEGDAAPLRATGAKVIRKDGSRATISVKDSGEVILAAGSIQSPQLLELSGIGNGEILKQHGIPVRIHNAGIGENLQDHTLSSVSYEIADDQMSADNVQRDASLQAAVMKMFEDSHDGPLAGTLLSIAYLPPVDKDGTVDRAELATLIEESLASSTDADFPARKRQYDILRARLANPQEPSVELMYLPMQLNNDAQRNTMRQIFGGAEPGNYITVVAILNHPFSRGSVHIRSADPLAPPAIDPRYLSHPLDLELQARHVQFLERFVQTSAMRAVLKEGGRRVPSAERDSADLATAKQMATERAFTCFHPSGTCAMMPRELDGVVDTRLKVYGTANLRVVDASVFPLETLGNIQATVYAVAEKAADMIREDGAKR